MFNQFRKDPNYLTKYHVTIGALLGLVNSIVFYFHPPVAQTLLWYLPALYLMTSTDLKMVMGAVAYAWIASFSQGDFRPINILAVVPAILLTFPFTSWIHSPAHGSLRPRWLNRPLGELMGIIQLTGFADWRIIHVIHHQYPDHPEFDPHPPLQKSYWNFAFGMRAQIGKSFMHYYFKYFGQNETSLKRIKYFLFAAKFNMAMKVLFWYMVMGPQFFSFFFTSSILFKMIHYSWFNWATHKQDQNGKYNIVNLDYSIYRLINFLTANLYYHGNHHLNPNVHNPKNVKTSEPAAEYAA